MIFCDIINNMNNKIKKLILVVEDEPNLLEAIKRKLEKENVNVLTAETGEQALGALEKQKPDLVWLDILLPGINGLEVLRSIRNNPLLKDLKVVAVSVSGGDDKIKEARALNVDDYIIKSENTLALITKRVLSYL